MQRANRHVSLENAINHTKHRFKLTNNSQILHTFAFAPGTKNPTTILPIKFSINLSKDVRSIRLVVIKQWHIQRIPSNYLWAPFTQYHATSYNWNIQHFTINALLGLFHRLCQLQSPYFQSLCHNTADAVFFLSLFFVKCLSPSKYNNKRHHNGHHTHIHHHSSLDRLYRMILAKQMKGAHPPLRNSISPLNK